MKKKLGQSGFTLAETLVTVGIMMIVAAFGFVSALTYKKNMEYLEAQSAAKEIFLASQEHLTLASMENLLDDENSSYNTGTTLSVNEFLVTSEEVSDKSSVLNLMLPDKSIDETIREGNYIIRYNKKNYKVMDVFYSSKTVLNTVDWDAVYEIKDDENAKKNYDGVLGYYGAFTKEVEVAVEKGTPVLTLVNGNVLYAKITVPATFSYDEITLKVAQEDNDKAFFMLDVSLSRFKNISLDGKTYREYYVILDDLYETHFSKLVNERTASDNKKIAIGSDIEVTVNALLSESQTDASLQGANKTFERKVKSTPQYANSLFADDTIITGTNANDKKINARISNFRHLENLGTNISSIGADGTFASLNAILCNNLSWDKFQNDYQSDYTKINKGDAPVISYESISCDYKFSFDGRRKAIENLECKEGIFGTINHEGVIKALDIYNIKVNSDTEDAGSLAGNVAISDAQLEILGVISRSATGKGASETSYGVYANGIGNAGGLIGSASLSGTGLLKLSESAAATYVQAQNGTAGGLVGKLSGSANIERCYSGGHTKDGKYQDTSTGQGRYNVYSKGAAAGGLIGDTHESIAGSVALSTVYSTSSVKGEEAGGIVGRGSVSVAATPTSYVAGKVFLNDGQVENTTANLADAAELARVLVDNSSGEKRRFADCYDRALIDGDYKSMFAYPNIYQLTNATVGYDYRFLNFHVGDWGYVDEKISDDTRLWTVRLVNVKNDDPTKPYATLQTDEGGNLSEYKNPSVLSTQSVMDGNSAILPNASNIEGWRWWTSSDNGTTWTQPNENLVYRYVDGVWGIYTLSVDSNGVRTYVLSAYTMSETFPGAVRSDLVLTPIYNDDWTVTIAYVDGAGNPIAGAQNTDITVRGAANSIDVVRREFGGYTFEGYYDHATGGAVVGTADAATLSLVSTVAGNEYNIKDGSRTIYARYSQIGTYTVRVNYWLDTTIDVTNIYTKTSIDSDMTVPVNFENRGSEGSAYIARQLVEMNDDTLLFNADSTADAASKEYSNWQSLDTTSGSYTYKNKTNTVINLYFTTEKSVEYKVYHIFNDSDPASSVDFDSYNRKMNDPATLIYLKDAQYTQIVEGSVSAGESINPEKLALATYDGFHVISAKKNSKKNSDGTWHVTITYDRNNIPVYFEQQEVDSGNKYATWEGSTKTLSSTHKEMFVLKSNMPYDSLEADGFLDKLPNNNDASKPQMMSEGYEFNGWEFYNYDASNNTVGAKLSSGDTIGEAVYAKPVWEIKKLPKITVELWQMKVDADTNGSLYSGSVPSDYANKESAYDFYGMVAVDTSAISEFSGQKLTGSNTSYDLALKLAQYGMSSLSSSEYDGTETVNGYAIPHFYHFSLNETFTASQNSGKEIKSDGTTVVRLYYTRAAITINFLAGSANYSNTSGTTAITGGDTLYYQSGTNWRGEAQYSELKASNISFSLDFDALKSDDNAISLVASGTKTYVRVNTSYIGDVFTRSSSGGWFSSYTYTKHTDYVYFAINETTDDKDELHWRSGSGFLVVTDATSWTGLYDEPFINYKNSDDSLKYDWNALGKMWKFDESGDSAYTLHTYFGIREESSFVNSDKTVINAISAGTLGTNQYYIWQERSDSGRKAYEVNKANKPNTNRDNYEDSGNIAMRDSGRNSTFKIVNKLPGYTVSYYSTGDYSTSKVKNVTVNSTSVSGNDNPLYTYSTRNAYTLYLQNYNLTSTQVSALKSRYGTNISVDANANSIQCLYLGDVYEALEILSDDMGADARPNTIDSDYTLEYWSQDSAGEKKIESGSLAMPSYNLIVFANWKAPTETVTFHNTTGPDSDTTQQITVNKSATISDGDMLSNPASEDYNFIGWYNDKNLLEPFSYKATPIESNRDVYAGWIGKNEIIFDIECYDTETNLPFYHERQKYTAGGSITISAPDKMTEDGERLNTELYSEQDVTARFGRTKVPTSIVYDSAGQGGTQQTLTFMYSLGSISRITYYVENYLVAGDDDVLLERKTISDNLTTDILTPDTIEGLSLVKTSKDTGSTPNTAISVENGETVKVYYKLETDRLSLQPKSGQYNGLEYNAAINAIPDILKEKMSGSDAIVKAQYTYEKDGAEATPVDAGTYDITGKLLIKNSGGNWISLWSGTSTETIAKRSVVLSATQKDTDGIDVTDFMSDTTQDKLTLNVGVVDTNDVIVIIPEADTSKLPANQVELDAVSSWADDDGWGVLSTDSDKLTITTPIEISRSKLEEVFEESAENEATVQIKITAVADNSIKHNYNIVNLNLTIKLKKS